MNISNFKHSTPIQLRFADTDVMRHINNANYHTYIELGRIKYFSDVVKLPVDWVQKGIILASVKMDYLKPVFFDDHIEVLTRCSRMGNKSFDFEYLIVRPHPDPLLEEREKEICASATTVQVCFDYVKNETIPMPEEWKKLFGEFEK